MTSSTATAIQPLSLKATHTLENLPAGSSLPTSVRGAPPELRRLIRKRQNSESAKRCRLRRKLEAQKDVGTQLTSNQQLEQLQQLVSDLANRLFQTQDIVAALVAHAQHNHQTQTHKLAMPTYNVNMMQHCKQEAVIAPQPQQQQTQPMMPISVPMQQPIQQQPMPIALSMPVPVAASAPVAPVQPITVQEQKQHVPVPPALADLSDLQYAQVAQPASPTCSSSTISTIENHPDIMAPAPNTPNAPETATAQEEVGSPFSDHHLDDIGTDFVYSVDLRDLASGNDAYNL